MARIFVSFLGLGPETEKIPLSVPGYREVTYSMNGTPLAPTRFVQRALIEFLGVDSFDRIHLLMTEKSRERHRDLLVSELAGIGLDQGRIEEDASIDPTMDDEGQWKWFESLLAAIQNGDEVVFDFTHGFRSVPIIFSTAISFLQRVRNFKLEHVYYGYMQDGAGSIVDMANFYRINEWADGVSRLVDSADASKLAALAEEEQGGFAALKDDDLVRALNDLTGIIKNIDVNRVADQADRALSIIRNKMDTCQGADRQLLEMVIAKFGSLAQEYPQSGKYDASYFQVQLELIGMLIRHGLLMQAYTVMRECVASLGMLGVTGKYAKKKMSTDDGRKYRRRFAELFNTMCSFPEEKWQYTDPEKRESLTELVRRDFDLLLPFYKRLEQDGIASRLHSLAGGMVKVRNGFDHAWTATGKGVPEDVLEQAGEYHSSLKGIIEEMKGLGYLAE